METNVDVDKESPHPEPEKEILKDASFHLPPY